MKQQEKTCETCRYMYTHYTISKEGRFIKVKCGHCTNPDVRPKSPDDPACPNYEEREKTCETCRYMHAHYTISRVGELIAVGCGHCTNSRSLTKSPDAAACPRYEEKDGE